MFPQQLRTRIAPTPSGYLHIGNVFSFALSHAIAHKTGGKLILRIDDLDNVRARQEYINDIFDTLNFLEILWDEGPKDATDLAKNYSQLKRQKLYFETLNKLLDKNLLYACNCTRSMLSAKAPDHKYKLYCREKNLPLDLNDTAWRIKIPASQIIYFHDVLLGDLNIKLAEEIPDFIVKRKDGIAAYQIASLCDDIEMNINYIVRGEDLLNSTAAQLFLAEQLGGNSFKETTFLHHQLIKENNGNKLSKSHHSLSIKQMRLAGLKNNEVWQKIGELAGLKKIYSADDFTHAFDVDKFIKAYKASSKNA